MEIIFIIISSFIASSFITLLFNDKKIIKNISKPKNKVHFYVARDKNSLLYLYLGKPKRADFYFMPCKDGYCFVDIPDLRKFGLNPDDFKDLKLENEPVEVFLNLDD